MQPLVGPMISYQASINGSYYGLVSIRQCGLIKNHRGLTDWLCDRYVSSAGT